MSLIAVITIAVLATSFLQLSSSITNRQKQGVNTKLAFYLAEAGLAEAHAGVMIGKTGNVGTATAPAVFGDGLFWVEATEDEEHDTLELKSTAMKGSGRAILSMVLERHEESLVSLGIFSSADLNLPPGTVIDGYDSSDGAYDERLDGATRTASTPGRLATNGNVTLTGTEADPTVVYGDLVVGPRAEIVIEGYVTTSGVTESAPRAQVLPPAQAPAVELTKGVEHTAGAPYVIPAGDTAYEFLHVGPDAEAVILGPSRLVVGTFTLAAGAALDFDTTDGDVELYVLEALDWSPASFVTTSEDPAGVTIQLAGEAASTARLAAEARFHGTVYAPLAAVTLEPDFEFFGSLVVGELILTGPVQLHFDRHLIDLSRESTLPTLLSWRILDLASPAPGNPSLDPFRFLGVDRGALSPPAESHADQSVHIDYVDLDGMERSFDGMESDFDWTEVEDVVLCTREGTTVVVPAISAARAAEEEKAEKEDKDKEALDTLADGTLSSGEKKEKLLKLTPVGLDPLKYACLMSDLSSGDLKAVLIANSPLPSEIVSIVTSGTTTLSAGDTDAVLKQQ